MKRILACLLSVILFFTEIPVPVFAEKQENAQLNGWSVQAVWSNLSTEYVWNAQEDEIAEPKIIITYRIDQAEKDYPAGSLRFTIPGIGAVSRLGVEKASKIVSEKEDSEWDYSWNEDEDVYVFSNKFGVEKGQSVSGGFELLWSLRTRRMKDGFSQSRIPLFSAADAGTVSLSPLSFSYTSVRDRYRIDMQRDKLYEDDYEASDKNYIWYEFKTRFDKDWCARGMQQSDYYVTVELSEDQDYADVIVKQEEETGSLKQDERGRWGFYLFQNRNGNIGSRYYTYSDTFVLGFKKETLKGAEVTVRSHLDRLYQDDSMWIREAMENEVVDAEISFTAEDYQFSYLGYTYDFEKGNTVYEDYKNPPKYAKRLNSAQIYSGAEVQFILSGSADRSYSKDTRGRSAAESDLATESDAEIFSEDIATESDAEVYTAAGRSSQIQENQEYAMVLGDDKLAVVLKNGSIRNLDDSEYDIDYVMIPSEKKPHDYEIYGAFAQDTPFEDYQLLESGNTSEQQVWNLPEGIKAVFVQTNEVYGSYISYAYVGVRFHLDWDQQQELKEELRPDHENHLVNFGYQRALYLDEDGELQNGCAVQAGNYSGIYGEKLAERDWETYNEYLKRDYSNVWLRSAVTDITAETAVEEWTSAERDGFASEISSSGSIQADNSGNLQRFSVYTLLSEGMKPDLDEGIVRIDGTAYDKNGTEVANLFDYMTLSVREMQGKNLVAADFDFSEYPLEIGKQTKVTIHFPVTLSYADYLEYGSQYTVNTYLFVHDGETDQLSGKAIRADEYDLDEDGDTSEIIAYAAADTVISQQANEWREYVSKYVKSEYSDGYVSDTVTRVSSDYSYRLQFGLGSDHAKNILFFDRLEQGEKQESQWQGTFVSVDTSYAERLGMIPVVYYSENPEQEYDLYSSGWTTEAPSDLSKIKSIAVELKTDAMEDGMMKNRQMVYADIHMRSPSDETFIGKKAVNQYMVQYDAYGLTDIFEKTYSLMSSETTVCLLDTVGRIILQKVDADGIQGHAALTGAKFQFYDSDENPLFEEAKSLNSLGRIVLKNLPYGIYYWEETEAPDGYQRIQGKHSFEIDGETEQIEIPNHRILGTVALKKTDDAGQLAGGAEYSLYYRKQTAGEYQLYGNYVTDDDESSSGYGSFSVGDLPWGDYYFIEKTAPVGYVLSDEKISFTVNRKTVQNQIFLQTTDERMRGSVQLEKVDKENPERYLTGAVFELYQADGTRCRAGLDYQLPEGSSRIETGLDGKILLTDIRQGEYYFQEIEAPESYCLSDDQIGFHITKENAAEVQVVTAENEKQRAFITIHKKINEVYPAFGEPTFLFRISGSNGRTYIRSITLDEAHLTGTVHLETEMGAVYHVKELPSSRYLLKEIIPVRNAAVSDGDTAQVDLMTETEGEVTFVNQIVQYEKFSHTDHAVNHVIVQQPKPAEMLQYCPEW